MIARKGRPRLRARAVLAAALCTCGIARAGACGVPPPAAMPAADAPAQELALAAVARARAGDLDSARALSRAAKQRAGVQPAQVQAMLAPVTVRTEGIAAAARELAAAAAALDGTSRGIALANLARLEPAPAAAQAAALEALSQLPPDEHEPSVVAARMAAAEVLARQGTREHAGRVIDIARQVHATAERSGEGMRAADALALAAMANLALERIEEAAAFASRATELAAAVDSPRLHDWLSLRAGILARSGKSEDALGDVERAVARLQRARGPVETDLADYGRTFRGEYGALYVDYADRLLRRAETSATAALRAASLHAAREALETSKAAEVAEYFRDPCIGRTTRARLEAPDPNAAVLYYVTLPDRVVALVSTREGIEQVRLETSPAALRAMVDDFRRLLEKRSTRQFLRPAQALHRVLLAPLLPLLDRSRARILVLVPDGFLRTVPFSALHDGRRFVIERHAVAVAPGLSLTEPRPLTAVDTDALVLGLTVARHGFNSLPAVADEVSALRSIVPARVAVDEGFVASRLLGELERSEAEIVHIASHGELASTVESSFILAYDGRVGLEALRRSIRAGAVRPRPLEILALSACQTAAGDERAALGLAGVAVQAGARSALATLWSVNDESTSMLVASFYRHAVRERRPRAEALRAAQLEMLGDDRFAHPAYWAPFLMIGSWL